MSSDGRPVFLPQQPLNPFQEGLLEASKADILTEMLLRLVPAEQLEVLRSHVEAPTVDDLLPYVSQYLHQLRTWFDTKVDDLMLVLEQRGREYGEEVLVVMGERGIHEMVRVKVHRNQGSFDQGSSIDERRDTHLDIAGYSILALALDQWKRDGGRIQLSGGDDEMANS